MTHADAEKIASHMTGNPKDVLLILRATGMRPKEVYWLRWEYVNWTAGSYLNPKGKTKNSRRQVPLLGNSVAILQRRRIESGMSVEGFVFPAKSEAGHIGPIGKAFRTARNAAGLPSQMCLYTARHGAATDLASVASLKEVMQVLGATAIPRSHLDINTRMFPICKHG